MTAPRRSRIDPLLALYEAAADADYVGERVSQLEHALQAAALAAEAGAPPVEVAAALLHDVGHLCAPPDAARMGGLGVVAHEEVGADFLARLGFPPSVTELVRGHVRAKRYLVATRPDYAERLSAASRHTLVHQGGPLPPEGVRRFEVAPERDAWLRLRSWDEQAKVPGRIVPGLEGYRRLLEDLVSAGGCSTSPAGD